MPSQVTIDRNHDVADAYYTNADFDSGGSVDLTKAYAFRTAVRRILGMRPQTASRGAQGNAELVTFNLEVLAEQLKQVTAVINLARAGRGGAISYGCLGDLR